MGKKTEETATVMTEPVVNTTEGDTNDNPTPEAQVPSDVEKMVDAILAKAQKTADEIVANAMKKVEKISSTAAKNAGTTDAPEPDDYSDLEKYVTVKLFKDKEKYKDDVFVSVNGENCVIQRGKDVRIKKKFALVLESSLKQDQFAAMYSEGLQNEFLEKEAAGKL